MPPERSSKILYLPLARAALSLLERAAPAAAFGLPILIIPTSLTSVEFIWSASSRMQSLAVYAAIYGSLAYGLALVMRFVGLPSVVHGALWGVGAYAAALAAVHWGWSLWAALPLSITIAMSVALAVGMPALRTTGMAFLIITIALAEFLVLVGFNWRSLTRGSFGIVIDRGIGPLGPLVLDSLVGRYYLALALLFASAALVWVVSRSAFGRTLEAIRDNETLARSLGINALVYKVLIFAVSAGVVGAAGALFVFHQRAITPDLFGTFPFITVVLMVVMGGMRVLAGPAVGAWLIVFLPEWLGPLGLDEPNRQRLLFGLLLMAFMMSAPEGILGTAKRSYVRLRSRLVGPKDTSVPSGQPATPSPAGSREVPRVTPISGSTSVGRPLLEVRGLKRHFGALKALDGIDLDVRDGEILGIMGPNGSGKTTLFNCVSKFVSPTDGRILWRGRDITKWSADRVARYGVVRTFQQPMVFGSATVRSSCRVAREALNTIGHREIARLDLPGETRDVLKLCGLDSVADAAVTALPYGQMRLVGIALALSTAPSVLMLDEPAAGLDDRESASLSELLRRVRAAGVTVVVTDHNVRFLTTLCERVVVLVAGVKILDGAPDDAKNDPAVIASYLGDRFVRQMSHRTSGHRRP